MLKRNIIEAYSNINPQSTQLTPNSHYSLQSQLVPKKTKSSQCQFQWKKRISTYRTTHSQFQQEINSATNASREFNEIPHRMSPNLVMDPGFLEREPNVLNPKRQPFQDQDYHKSMCFAIQMVNNNLPETIQSHW